MKFLIKYSMPLLAALLICCFYSFLPNLKACKLRYEERDKYKLSRADALIMAVISLAYAAVGFARLGDREAPQSFADMNTRTVHVMPELYAGTVEHLAIYTGVGIGRYSISYSTDGTDRYELAVFEQTHADVLKWHKVSIDYYVSGGSIAIEGAGNVWLGELVLFDKDGNIIPYSTDEQALCDEQSLASDKATYMNSSYFDEIYHARTAWEHINGISPYEITHPPLGKEIISLGILLFGMTPFGWRFSGTLFGVLMLPIAYIFAKKLFGGRHVPTACTLLFAGDFMHFVQTRISTIDTYAVFFILLMYLFMYIFISNQKSYALALCGICFGLGAASKWTCMYAGAGLALIWLSWIVGQYKNGHMDRRAILKNIGFCTVFFVLIPCLIYAIAYLPYGRAIGAPLFSSEYWNTVLQNQSYMFSYHSNVNATHPYSSRWYQWLLDIRPILYYLDYQPDGMHTSFGAFVNPLLCWGGLLSLFVLIYCAIFRKDKTAAFLLVAYLAQLVPWLFVQRVTFEYHYFPCAAMLVLTLGYIFSLVEQDSKQGKYYIYTYASLSIMLFVLFYPVLAGTPIISSQYIKWLPTWPF